MVDVKFPVSGDQMKAFAVEGLAKILDDPSIKTASGRTWWREISRIGLQISDWCAYYSSSHNDYKNAFASGTSDDALQKCVEGTDTIEKCGSQSEHMFNYVADADDYWQTPKETWNRRTSGITGQKMEGDCEDWSGFFVNELKNHGFDVYLLVCWGKDIYGKESGHAICYVPSLGQTVCTFNRINHGLIGLKGSDGTDNVELVAQRWYSELSGYILYKMNDDYSYDQVNGVVYTGRAALGDTEGAVNKKLMPLDGFVKKLSTIDPDARKIVEYSYHRNQDNHNLIKGIIEKVFAKT
jgi:hypothetical protein